MGYVCLLNFFMLHVTSYAHPLHTYYVNKKNPAGRIAYRYCQQVSLYIAQPLFCLSLAAYICVVLCVYDLKLPHHGFCLFVELSSLLRVLSFCSE